MSYWPSQLQWHRRHSMMFQCSWNSQSLTEVRNCGGIKVMMDFIRGGTCVVVTVRSLDFQDIMRTLLWSFVFGGAANHGWWTALHCFVKTLYFHSFDECWQFAGKCLVKSIFCRAVLNYMFRARKRHTLIERRTYTSRTVLNHMSTAGKRQTYWQKDALTLPLLSG